MFHSQPILPCSKWRNGEKHVGEYCGNCHGYVEKVLNPDHAVDGPYFTPVLMAEPEQLLRAWGRLQVRKRFLVAPWCPRVVRPRGDVMQAWEGSYQTKRASLCDQVRQFLEDAKVFGCNLYS